MNSGGQDSGWQAQLRFTEGHWETRRHPMSSSLDWGRLHRRSVAGAGGTSRAMEFTRRGKMRQGKAHFATKLAGV